MNSRSLRTDDIAGFFILNFKTKPFAGAKPKSYYGQAKRDYANIENKFKFKF